MNYQHANTAPGHPCPRGVRTSLYIPPGKFFFVGWALPTIVRLKRDRLVSHAHSADLEMQLFKKTWCPVALLRKRFFSGILLLAMTHAAYAETVSIAVASNALDAVKLISRDFQKEYGHTTRISSGSTGKLYAQIYNGAPFDVFLAANAREPQRLEEQGLIVKGSRFTYALGQLSLCKQAAIKSTSLGTILADPALKRLAIANPKTAPYGAAAQQVLASLGVWQTLKPKLISGENIGQALQYFVSGNTQAAFLARSQVMAKPMAGGCVTVAQKYYRPIRQQAVVLKRAKDAVAVKLFIDYLKSQKVKTVLSKRFGYGVE